MRMLMRILEDLVFGSIVIARAKERQTQHRRKLSLYIFRESEESR